MATKVEICNLAISWLGGNPIISLDDSTNEAALCKANYDLQRDACLQAFDWTFATKRATLPVSGSNILWGESLNLFTLPADCLRVLSADETEIDSRYLDWRVEGKNIVSSAAAIYLRYIYRVEDPQQFPALFVHALAARMAADLAIPLTRSTQYRQQCWQLYMQKINEAANSDGLIGRSDKLRTNLLQRVRYGTSLAQYGLV